MIRGTTPTITYTFPIDMSNVQKFRMYFIQGSEVVLEKTEEDCSIVGNTVKTTLSQEETYSLSTKKLLITKARFLTNDGKVYGTKGMNIRVEGNDTSGSEVLSV